MSPLPPASSVLNKTEVVAEHSFPDVARRNLMMQYVELPMVLRIFSVPKTARIIDLGSGRGFGVAALISRGFSNVTGVDCDAVALQHGLSEKAHSICADARATPIRSESIEIVLDFGTSYHAGDSAASLAEIQRVLRPGGRYIYETRASQLLSHPVRSRGKMLPWSAAPRLQPDRHAILWASRIKR